MLSCTQPRTVSIWILTNFASDGLNSHLAKAFVTTSRKLFFVTRFQSLVRSSLLAIIVCASSSASSAASSGGDVKMNSVVQEAQKLIASKQPNAALELLQPAAQNYAGNPRFDYTLALAFMDSGDNASAELVFERLLTQSPRFHGARLRLRRRQSVADPGLQQAQHGRHFAGRLLPGHDQPGRGAT